MERISNRSIHARLTFQREIKIGIAKNTKQRNRDVDNAIKGDVIIRRRITVRDAKRVEKKLHHLLGDSRFRIKGGRQGGVTEWFYLNPLEYALLHLHMTYYEHEQKIKTAFIITLIITAWILKNTL